MVNIPPLTTLSRHVEYVLVAEFDIDKGASLAHQYPEPTGADEHFLAELMLPDGAHLREEDWTVFFLNQKEGREVGTPPPLLYTLSLVRTKLIPGVKRGALVKAMAIATRHQWIQVFKPLLVLALEKYLQSGDVAIVQNLYRSINSMDLSAMPRLSMDERKILRASEDKNMFEERFWEMEERAARIADTKLQRGNSNAASFSSNGRKSSIASSLSSKNTAKTHKDRQFFETKIGFDGIMVPVRIPLTMLPEEVGEFSVARLVSTFSIFPTPFPQPPSSYRLGAPYYWHPHLDTGPTTPALVVLVNAILTQKRVLFLGHGKPAGEVMNFVLSACAIAGGGALLRGFTERCFPYIGLQGLDLLLSTPGYIAGVTNPVFEEQTSWWDVLCNINTGKVMVSPKIEPAPPPAAGQPSDMGNTQQAELYDRLTGSWEPDIDLIQDATTSIGAHVAEVYIRQKFYDYVHRVVEVAGSLEQELFGQTSIGLTANDFGGSQIAVDIGIGTFFPDSNSRKREISFLRNRIEGWRATRSYVYLQKDFQSLVRRRAFRTTDVRHAISRLRFGQYITDSNTLKIYLGLQDVLAAGSDLQISEFLTYVPQASGGLFPIAMGLLHPRWEVRRAACRIMARLDWHKVISNTA
ncbi:docking domain of Afi1 for Arf3 in vesicle trafficking-domain-containing protein [Cladochytrium replicatum]|nr:docking domain of Afi1 for Arf3 in vesicle trafficking-domain-containing protein [Cladochytrium replicatum]